MLQCLVAAVRPLRVEELAELLAFDFDAAPRGIPKYRPALRLDDQTQAVLSTCSSLVVVIYERWSNRQVVQFSHFSVKEFLVSNRLASSLGNISQYRICLGSAHTTLTQACLGLLLHPDNDIVEEIVKGSPLADYAASHWVEHAQFEDVASRVKDGMETLFDPDKPHFEAWVEIHNIDPGATMRDISEYPTPLYYSALCGFNDLVEHLSINYPHYVNALGGQHKFPLLAALVQGHFEVAKSLLKRGADVDVRESTGKTILLVSLSYHKEEDKLLKVVDFLLEHGADVNARDDTFQSSLHLAENYGMQQVATILVENHADVNVQDNHGKTPLHRLLGTYHDYNSDHVRLLLECGAEVDIRDKDNQTPFCLAVQSGCVRTMRILLECGADAIVEKNGELLWNLLAKSRIDDKDSDEVLNDALPVLLLKLGVDLKWDDNNKTLLHLAMRWNRFRVAGSLLEHGADANAEDSWGMTPLHIWSESHIEDKNIILNLGRLLLKKHGAEVNRRDKDNQTPLHLAMCSRFILLAETKAETLLEHGADANAQDKFGMTPLHILLKGHDIEDEGMGTVLDLVLLLLKNGAEVNRCNNYEETPLHLAIQKNQFKVAGLLLENGSVDTRVKNRKGRTPLHVLSKCDFKGMDEADKKDILNLGLLLIKHGAEVNSRDKHNKTPLHLAMHDQPMLAEPLLEHGADINAEDDKGQTPLQALSQIYTGKYFKYEGIILNLALLLLKKGAEVNRHEEDGDTPLHLAVQNNGFRLAGVFLEYGADANAANNKGITPLRILSESNSDDERNLLDLAQLLLNNGAEVNRKDRDNKTPLHLAVQRKRFRLAGILLERGADANAENNEGMTPLQILSKSYACDESEILNFAQLLLNNGAEVQRRDKDSETPLHLVIRRNWFRLAGILLKHGADTNVENNKGQTPFHTLLSQSHIRGSEKGKTLDLALLLYKNGAEVNRRDEANQTLLHLAIRADQFRLAGILLEHGADANAENNEGMTPLQILSERYADDESESEILNVAQLLLNNGAEVHRRDKDSETPLHLVIRRNSFGFVSKFARILLEHGADANAKSVKGVTPLHILSPRYFEDEHIVNLAQLLFDNGAEVNSPDNDNVTPLHLAINHNQFMLARLLLERGADANVENNEGKTPFHILSQSYIEDEGIVVNFALLLKNHGAEVDTRDKANRTPLHLAIRRNRSMLVEILLENGADLNAENNEGMTPFQILVEKNTNDDSNLLDLAQVLLKHGAEVNRRNKDGQNPLHLAMRRNQSRLMEMLLEHGADANAKNNQGMFPLEILSDPERYYQTSDEEDNIVDLAQLLLKHGAEVNRRCKANETPLHRAIRRNRSRLAWILLENCADANAENNEGQTMLHILSECDSFRDEGALKLLSLLLRKGADVNKRDRANETPLHLAMRRNRFMLVKTLLEHGADFNVQNNEGQTFFHMLSECYLWSEGRIRNLVPWLLNRGAEVNKQDNANETPLHLAIRRCRFKFTRTLLVYGADTNAENDKGQTPLHILLSQNLNYYIWCYFVDRDLKLSDKAWTKARGDISNLVLLLLKNGAEVNSRDKDNETPLHLAIRWGWFKLAGILLKHGADADAENDDGKTPLRLLSECCSHDNGDLIKHASLFLGDAVRGNPQDENNDTSLHMGIGEAREGK